MPKFIVRKELEDMYGLVSITRPVGVIQACFAIGAKDLQVVETFSGYLVAATHIDGEDITCFNINIDTYIAKDFIIMKNATSGVSIFISKHFGGYVRPMFDRTKDYVSFVDFNMQKEFSRWLHTENPEAYDTIVENNMFQTNVRFKQIFNIEEIYNHLKYDKSFVADDSYELSFSGSICVPLDGDHINAIKTFSEKVGRVYCYEDDNSVGNFQDIHDFTGDVDLVIPYSKTFVQVSKEDFLEFVEWFYELSETTKEHFSVLARLTFDSKTSK